MLHKYYHRQDYLLAVTTFILVVFGLIMMASASVVESYHVTGHTNFYFLRQLGYAVAGLFGWWLASKIDYHFWKKYATILMGIGVLLLLVVLIPGISLEAGGAKRWIHLGFITFQPSELMKLTATVYLSYWFDRRHNRMNEFYVTFLPFTVMLGVISLLIMQQPDLGTSLVVASIAATMYVVAGASWSQIGILTGLGVGGVVLMIKAAPYRLGRLLTFLNPGADPLGAGYHVNQALLAIGSGGIFGLGYGHSRQKHNFLPEASSDSIFAIIGEELGLLGSVSLVIIPFAIIVWRGLIIAKRAPDMFGRMLAIGITTWIGIQALLNM